jgi:hypothetical protein
VDIREEELGNRENIKLNNGPINLYLVFPSPAPDALLLNAVVVVAVGL